MPVLCTFFGIVIRVFHDDHAPPHFHVEYAEFEAVIEIRTGAALAGRLPPRAAAMVEEWRKKRAPAILEAWNAAQAGKMPPRVRPLV